MTTFENIKERVTVPQAASYTALRPVTVCAVVSSIATSTRQ